MPTVRINRFVSGIVSSQALDGTEGGEFISNLDVDSYGNLVPRKGMKKLNVSALDGPIFGIYRGLLYQVYQKPSDEIRYRTNIVCKVATSSSSALKRFRINVGLFSDIKNYSNATPSNIRLVTRYDLFSEAVLFDNRLFLGFSDNKRPCWADLLEIVGDPSAYDLGRDKPTNPSLALSADGDLQENSWYGFAYTYYNSRYGIETKPTDTVAIQTTSTDRKVIVTLTRDVDRQWNYFRVYRTLPQSSESLAKAAAIYKVGDVAHNPGTGTISVVIDNTTIDGSQYTLGHENDTLDHDVLSERWTYAINYAQRIWAVILPRKIVFSKLTSTHVVPDFFPAENYVNIGTEDESITGIEINPSGEGLLIFTNKTVYTLRGTNLNDLSISQQSGVMGCSYPRTIVNAGDFIIYLGTDNQVWITDGVSYRPISRKVNHLIKHLIPSPSLSVWGFIPCAALYHRRYFLSFYGDKPLTTSSFNTTVTTTTNNLFMVSVVGTANYIVKDNNGTLDLSKIKKGMVLCSSFSGTLNPDNVAIITNVDTIAQTVTTEQGPPHWVSGEKFDVFYNDKCLVYSIDLDYWTFYDNVNALSLMEWYSQVGYSRSSYNFNYLGGLYIGRSDSYDLYHMQIVNEGYSDDNSTPIISAYKSQWMKWGSHVNLTSVRVVPVTPITSPLVLKVYKDYSGSEVVSKTFTPSASNLYKSGVFCRGTSHQIEVIGNNLSIQEVIMEVN